MHYYLSCRLFKTTAASIIVVEECRGDSDNHLYICYAVHVVDISVMNYINGIIFFSFADGFSRFKAAYPEWCDSCTELLDTSGGMPMAAGPDPLPLMGLRSLRISNQPLHRPHRSCESLSSAANSSTDSSDTDDRCDSSLGKYR